MSDDIAFLVALKACPADDVTRLVYADWLDERDDPRGRYLRLVCQLAAGDEHELIGSAAARELVELSKWCNPVWEEWAGARFELALIEYALPDREHLVMALERVLTPLPALEIRALLAKTPTALRTPLPYRLARDLYWDWLRYVRWFQGRPKVVLRAVPPPLYSETGLFDVVLHRLPRDFWPHWPMTYKQPVSTLLGLPSREAADRVRRLPAVLFRALPQADLELALGRTRYAFNKRGCDPLPPDALTVEPHVPAQAVSTPR